MHLLRVLPVRVRILLCHVALVGALLVWTKQYVPPAETELYWLLVIAALAAAAALALIVSRSITAPLAALRKKLRECLETDRDHVFRDRAGDEIGELYRAVNDYVLYRDNEAIGRAATAPPAVGPRPPETPGRRELDHLGLLADLGPTLSLNYDFGDAASHVLARVNQHLSLEWSSVLVWDGDQKGMRLAASVGLDPKLSTEVRSGDRPVVQFKPGEGIAGEVFASGQAMIINKGYKDKKFKHFPKFTYNYRRINTMACIPLTHEGTVTGVANFINIQEPPVFSEEHVVFLARVAEVLSSLHAKSTRFDVAFREATSGLYSPSYFHYLMSLEGDRVKRRPQNASLVKISVSFLDASREQELRADVHRRIGDLIKGSFRRVDLTTREQNTFVICLPNTDPLGALFTAGRLKEQIDAFSYDEHDRQLFSTSGGLASFPDPVSDWVQLSPSADRALAEAARIGDNRVVCFRPGSEPAADPSPVSAATLEA